MQRLLVLGGGTAGTMVVNKLRSKLDRDQWQITVVDQDDKHLYQPGFLFIPFGVYAPAEVQRSRHRYIPDGVELVLGEIDRVDADANKVLLTDGRELGYNYLVIATGTTPRPDQTPGMLGSQWRKSIFDFYSLDGATALTGALAKPIASQHLGSMLTERKVEVEPDFMVERIDDENKTLISYDEREIPFDLLVTVPLNMGADYIARSGLGDELNYVPVDKHTLRSKTHDNIFAIGDASDIPASKAGSVAHFAAEAFVDNFVELVHGDVMTHSFDGHANCFIESGNGKGMLIDFNYDTEPLPGKYPVPGIGPFSLLTETRANHLGKLGFRWAYWHLLLRGHPLPVPSLMSMAGKHPEPTELVK